MGFRGINENKPRNRFRNLFYPSRPASSIFAFRQQYYQHFYYFDNDKASKGLRCSNNLRQRGICTRRPFIYCLCLMIVYVMYLNYSMYNFKGVKAGQLDAIVTVAMCGYNARQMVQSLRTTGQWKNPIFVLTDDPQEEDSSLCTPIDIRGNHPKFAKYDDRHDTIYVSSTEWSDYKQALGRWKALYSKWHKTQIFRLISTKAVDNKQAQTLLFMDADMIVQQSLEKYFLPQVMPMIANPDCELIVYPERWYTTIPILGGKNKTATGRYNSGLMILKRRESTQLLETWSHLMVHPEFMDRDQGKLTRAIDTLQTKVCTLPNPWRHMQIAADVIDTIWFGVTGKGTFYHAASFQKDYSTKHHCNYTWPEE